MTHEERCDSLLNPDPRIGHGALQRLMWMKRDAEHRVRNTYDPKAQNEAANDFHAFDAAIKAIAAVNALPELLRVYRASQAMTPRPQEWQEIQFADGPHLVSARDFPRQVVAAKDDEHGDWKTALVRKFPRLKAGDTAELMEVWTNCYGRWARVRIDGQVIDVRPSSLNFTAPPAPDGIRESAPFPTKQQAAATTATPPSFGSDCTF